MKNSAKALIKLKALKKGKVKKMKRREVEKFMKENDCKLPDGWDRVFDAGYYEAQDLDYERDYNLEDGSVYMVADKDDLYAYVSTYDQDEYQSHDCYMPFEALERLIEMLEREGK